MRLRHAPLLLAPLLAGVAGGAASASITGVCPDGSFFVVQRAESIPCRDAKRVDPQDLPPLKPELLPRPYAWEVFQRERDPNNPYNLVDDARGEASGSAGEAEPGAEALPAVGSAPPPAPVPSAPARLSLGENEARDLSLIVELSQERAPASLEGEGVLLRLAHSRSFEPRARAALGTGDAPVLLFAAQAREAAAFHPNLTFVQGHLAFHPDPAEPEQLGLLRGKAGPLAAGESLLGYVVLPERIDLSQPLDVYWDDRRMRTTLRP